MLRLNHVFLFSIILHTANYPYISLHSTNIILQTKNLKEETKTLNEEISIKQVSISNQQRDIKVFIIFQGKYLKLGSYMN